MIYNNFHNSGYAGKKEINLFSNRHNRSKYKPHVGVKQRAKITKRLNAEFAKTYL